MKKSALQGNAMRDSMNRVILTLLAASGLAALGALPAEAVGTRYPFCIQGDEYPGLSYCTFTSYEQCQATASGRFLQCIANPYYVGDSDAPRAYRGRGRPLPPPYPGYPRY
jgi:hypothetical protein